MSKLAHYLEAEMTNDLILLRDQRAFRILFIRVFTLDPKHSYKQLIKHSINVQV